MNKEEGIMNEELETMNTEGGRRKKECCSSDFVFCLLLPQATRPRFPTHESPRNHDFSRSC
jgi:hypothetical protein